MIFVLHTSFTTTMEQLPQADILMALGSLQFVEAPFEMLGSATPLPPHILLNKVPVRDLPAAATLMNMGSAFCPYHLFNRKEFVESFQSFGYELVDEWENPELGADIPLHPQESVPAFSGYYFRKSTAHN